MQQNTQHHHVIAGSLLALFVLVLPQVQVALADVATSTDQLVPNVREHRRMPQQFNRLSDTASSSPMMRGDGEHRGLPPEVVVEILYRAQVISPDKIDQARQIAHKLGAAERSEQGMMDATSTRPMMPPFNASSTRQFRGDAASTTMRWSDRPQTGSGDTMFIGEPPMPPQGTTNSGAGQSQGTRTSMPMRMARPEVSTGAGVLPDQAREH